MKIRNSVTALALLTSVSIFVNTAAAETYRPECFTPATPETNIIQKDAKTGPFRIALVNGYVGNDFRVNMVQSAKVWAGMPENKKVLKEFKVISVGNDVSAQIAAVDNLIAAGFDGMALLAVNPASFGPVLKRADAAGVAIVPFDNTLDTNTVAQVNENQFELGKIKAEDVLRRIGDKKNAKVLEVRGLPGNSAERDMHDGARSVLDARSDMTVVEVLGNWDTGTTQKVVADAISTQGPFDGVVCQHGCAGVVRAMKATNHPMVPIGVDAENGTRLEMVNNKVPGVSAAQVPAMSAVALDAVVAVLEGHPMPSMSYLPIPHVTTENMKEGVDYFPNLPNTFYAASAFPACGINFTANDLMGQSADNN